MPFSLQLLVNMYPLNPKHIKGLVGGFVNVCMQGIVTILFSAVLVFNHIPRSAENLESWERSLSKFL